MSRMQTAPHFHRFAADHPTIAKVLVVTLLSLPWVSHAEIFSVEGESTSLRLGGFVSTALGLQHVPYDTGGLSPTWSGADTGVFRLEWSADLTPWLRAEAHDRFLWRLQNTTSSSGSLGLGSTIAPARTVDLKTPFVESDGVYLEHDLDRAALTFLTPVADITVGRQAITWGNSTLFAVVDFWTQFSPFEQDTSQKRGIDALRAIAYPGELEIDAVIVDRGSLDLASGGIRVATTLDAIDGYVAAAKSYETLYAAMGAQLDWSSSRIHTEAALPVEIDDIQVRLPTWTAGIDYFVSSDLMLGLEYQLRGRGTSSTSDYLERLSGDSTARGEEYLLGRHYAGVTASYQLRPDITTAVAAIGNLTDPSVLVLPSIQYAIGDQGRLEFVAYQAFGNRPRLRLPPDLTSEFGTYPNLYLVQLSMYL